MEGAFSWLKGCHRAASLVKAYRDCAYVCSSSLTSTAQGMDGKSQVRTCRASVVAMELFNLVLVCRVLKVGVGCVEDGKRLQRDWNFAVRGCVDISAVWLRTLHAFAERAPEEEPSQPDTTPYSLPRFFKARSRVVGNFAPAEAVAPASTTAASDTSFVIVRSSLYPDLTYRVPVATAPASTVTLSTDHGTDAGEVPQEQDDIEDEVELTRSAPVDPTMLPNVASLSLKSFTFAFCGHVMDKSPHVRMGDWEVEHLSAHQLLYASADAFYSRSVFASLFGWWLHALHVDTNLGSTAPAPGLQYSSLRQDLDRFVVDLLDRKVTANIIPGSQLGNVERRLQKAAAKKLLRAQKKMTRLQRKYSQEKTGSVCVLSVSMQYPIRLRCSINHAELSGHDSFTKHSHKRRSPHPARISNSAQTRRT